MNKKIFKKNKTKFYLIEKKEMKIFVFFSNEKKLVTSDNLYSLLPSQQKSNLLIKDSYIYEQ